MYQFKEGDKVKVPVTKSYGDSYNWFKEDLDKKGIPDYLVIYDIKPLYNQEGVVSLNFPDRRSLSHNLFKLSDLEPYEEVANIEVGDEVEVVSCKSKASVGGNDVGYKGVVTELAQNLRVDCAILDRKYYTALTDLKLIKKANMEKRIIGYKLKEGFPASTAEKISKGFEIYRTINDPGIDFYTHSLACDQFRAAGLLDVMFDKVYEPEKPKEIIITLADKNTEVRIKKGIIWAGGDSYTGSDLGYILATFKSIKKEIGSRGIEVSIGTLKVGCTHITPVELVEIERAWKELNP